jgi:hypothetical protein
MRATVRAVMAAVGAVCLGLCAPLAAAQITGLAVTPTDTCVFQGPEGGPFSPTSCDLSLVNSTAAPIQVDASFFVNWNPAWISGTIDGQAITGSTAQRITVPANGSLPMRLSLTEGVSTVTNDASDRIGGFNIADVEVPQRALSAIGRLQFTAGNDFFAGAQRINEVTFSRSGLNTGASKEPGEPNHAGNPGGASIWYRFDTPAGASGAVTLNTNFSSFDTLLAVYTGTSLDALTQVAANDDANGQTTSALTFNAAAGQSYYVAIDGAARNGGPAATGFFQLNITTNFAVANDAFTSARQLEGESGSVTQFASQFAQPTRETNEPAHGGGFGGSTWFRWVAPTTGAYSFTAGGTTLGNFPVIAAYIGDGVAGLTEVAATTILASATNTLRFTALAGTEYRIALAGTLFGSYDVTWGPTTPAVPYGLFASILPTSRAVGQGQVAGVFANMLNSTTETGRNCRPESPRSLDFVTPNGFIYQTTNAQNQLVGTPNTPVDIPAGATQNFLLNLTRADLITSGRIGLQFVCDNLAPAPLFPEANAWVLRVLTPAPADIIAIGATAGTIPGVVDVPLNGNAAFAAAGINIGEDAAITVRPSASVPAGLSLTVCETNAQSQCLSPAAPSITVPLFEEGDVRTFSVFVASTGAVVPFDPGFRRIALNFEQGTQLVGATSVAVRTVQAPGG